MWQRKSTLFGRPFPDLLQCYWRLEKVYYGHMRLFNRLLENCASVNVRNYNWNNYWLTLDNNECHFSGIEEVSSSNYNIDAVKNRIS